MWNGPSLRMAVVSMSITVGSSGAVLLAGGGAYAHATVRLTINHDGRGNIWTDVAWADGHPVTQAVAATMTAVSDTGRQVGPVALDRLPGKPTVVYAKALPTGDWRVTVDAALPGMGHCEAVVRVGGSANAGATRCGDPPPTRPTTTLTASTTGGPPDTAARRRTSGWRWSAPAALLLLGGLVGSALLLRTWPGTGARRGHAHSARGAGRRPGTASRCGTTEGTDRAGGRSSRRGSARSNRAGRGTGTSPH